MKWIKIIAAILIIVYAVPKAYVAQSVRNDRLAVMYALASVLSIIYVFYVYDKYKK